MDQYRIILMPRAGRDLEEIYDHIAQDSPNKAADVVARPLMRWSP